MASVPNTIALTSIADGALAVAATLRNNHSAIQTAVNGTIAVLDEIDAKGDLLVGSGADAIDNLTVGSNGMVLVADSTQTLGVKWAYPSGYQWDRVTKTTAVTSTATTEGTATTILTSNSFTSDGSAIEIEFWSPDVFNNGAAGTATYIALFLDSTSLGRAVIGNANAGGADNPYSVRTSTPASAAAHTVTAKLYVSGNTGSVGAGAGGASTSLPMFLKVTKA